MESAEIRLRVIEALTRTDGSMARNDPKRFCEVVAQIETFVVSVEVTTEPEASAPAQKKGSKKADKDTKPEEGNADFLD